MSQQVESGRKKSLTKLRFLARTLQSVEMTKERRSRGQAGPDRREAWLVACKS